MKKTILTLIIFLCPFLITGQEIRRDIFSLQDSFIVNFEKQLEIFPQEKLHLHLDRDYFIPGDKIWFKAYLVDAQTHLSVSESRYVYVELIDFNGNLINRVMIRPDWQYSYLFHGHIFLSDLIPPGEYTIRAYTRYMEYMGNDYFFKRTIRVGNISTSDIGQTNEIQNSIIKNENEDYTVSFFPEGGQMLVGSPSRIAFKALNSSGYSEHITGEIVDENNNFIVSLNTFHLGMGVFSIIPEDGKKYFAICKNKENKEKKIELPKAINNGFSLFANLRNGKLNISLTSNSSYSQSQPMSILLHSRGNVIYFDKWEESRNTLSILEEQLPPGIIQIVLFDDKMNPISERLVFCKNEQLVKTMITTDKERYKMREKVSVTVNTFDLDELPAKANLSVAVTDERDVFLDESYSILSTFLLSSELKGYIESPGFYFVEDTEEARYALDCLMMTQGWRRYDLSHIAQGMIEEPTIKPEKGMEINGQVRHQVLNRPIPNSEVSLLVTEFVELLQTTTNDRGLFKFEEIEFHDEMPFIIQALNTRGRENVRLQVNSVLFPNPQILSLNPSPYYFFSNKTDRDSIDESFLLKAKERYKYDEDLRMIYLQEIEVIASRITSSKRSEKLSVYSGSAAYSVTSQSIEEANPVDIYDILKTIPGVAVINGNIKIQGRSGSPSIYVDDLLVIEGVPESASLGGGESGESGKSSESSNSFEEALMMVNINSIERIDIFKGSEAAIFGTMGGSGVISIISKRGDNIKSSTQSALNRLHITPFGYQKPVEFYSPVYDTEEKRFGVTPDLRTTIYWKPDLIISESGEALFDFYTADYTTNYAILIEGITPQGDIIRQIKRIKVD